MLKMTKEEWIVSSEELKRNREKALLKDKQLMDEKKEKIELIAFAVIAIILITISIIFINKMDNKVIKNCINNGNSANFCNKNIRG